MKLAIRLHSFLSLPFWDLWFLMHMKDFYPFQILYLCCIPIGIKFNDCGLIVKLQNAFESLKLGLYRIMFLCVIFAQCDELKIMIFFTVAGEDDSSLYCSHKYCSLSLAFVSLRRWVRLLFGREFPLQDLLVVWDALFADGLTLTLVDYIFVAMLLYIRDACKC